MNYSDRIRFLNDIGVTIIITYSDSDLFGFVVITQVGVSFILIRVLRKVMYPNRHDLCK